MNLSPIEIDALKEIYNIGVGKASATLSQLVNEEILMSVPTLEILPVAEMKDKFETGEKGEAVGIFQEFQGDYSATGGLMLFSQEKSIELVRFMVQDKYKDSDLTHLEEEALEEIGNILLNACIGTICNLVGASMQSGLPHIKRGLADEIIESLEREPDDLVVLIHIRFSIKNHDIEGMMFFALNSASFETMVGDAVKKMLGTGT